MNFGVLNTIIAMVIVLLVLSLIVQAIQGFLKKVLKLKSNQIEASLEDLYEQALSQASENPPAVLERPTPFANVKASVINWLMPILTFLQRLLGRKPPVSGAAQSPAQQFKDRIVQEFNDIGRSSTWGNPVLDSLSKEDLLKIMTKLESASFFPDYVKNFQQVVDELSRLGNAIQALSENQILVGSASAKLAEIRMVLAPLFNDVQKIVEGDKVKPKIIFGDLIRFRNIKLNQVPELLNDAQQAITQEIEVASKTDPDRVTALRDLSGELSKIARLVGNLNQKFDSAVAPLRIKLAQVETWYDTVMQSFDERYARNMKSVAILISIFVVVLLNANFFIVYRNLAKNQIQTNLIVQNGEKLLEESRKANPTPTPEPTPTASAEPDATQSPSATPTPTTQAATSTSTSPVTPSPMPSATMTPSPTPTPVDIKKEAEETKQDIDTYVNMYEQFGFAPLSLDQAISWLWSTGVWTWPWHDERGGGFWGFTIARNEKGVPLTKLINGSRRTILTDCQEINSDGKAITYEDGASVSCSADWRPLTGGEWRASRRHDVTVLFGWAIMVLLLSVGAPFWQDTLESLFGVKNLLRQKSGTQNIETKSGAGQPKQA